MGVVQRHVLAAKVARLGVQASDGWSAGFSSEQRGIIQKRAEIGVTREEFVLVRDIPIVAYVKLVLIEQHGTASGIVHVSVLAQIGAWQPAKNFCGHAADPIRADEVQNAVASKLLTSRPVGIPGQGIKNWVGSREGAEVASPESIVGHGGGQRSSLTRSSQLEISKEEHAVLLNWASQAKPSLVPLEGRRSKAFPVLASGGYFLGKGVCRKGCTVAMEIKCGTVNLVGS